MAKKVKLKKGTYKPTGNGGGAAAKARDKLRAEAIRMADESDKAEIRAYFIIQELKRKNI